MVRLEKMIAIAGMFPPRVSPTQTHLTSTVYTFLRFVAEMVNLVVKLRYHVGQFYTLCTMLESIPSMRERRPQLFHAF